MSRHNIPARNGRTRITVGWDRPLDTYFAQVFREADDPDEDDEQVLWRGFGSAMGDRLDTPEEAITLVQPHAAEIPGGLADALRADRRLGR